MSAESEQFLKIVQEAAGISREEAEQATRATLAVLADRIDAGEARQLAATLPDGVAAWLHTGTPAQGFGLEDFVRRVAEQLGTGPQAARVRAAAVFAALRQTATRDELEDVAAELPREFQPLIGVPAPG
jgi:uncharacterized protein (DUF2267 family)